MAKITDDVKYPPVDAAAETDTYLTIRAGALVKTALSKILAYLGITRAVDSLTIDRSVVMGDAIATPIISKGPAIINSGFAGAVSTSGSSTSVVFSSAADAIKAGYDPVNPVIGTTLVTADPYTRHIVGWTNATTCVVHRAVNLAAGTAISSVQLPITTTLDYTGASAPEYVLANKTKVIGGIHILAAPTRWVLNSLYNTMDATVFASYILGGGSDGWPNRIGSRSLPAGTGLTPTGWAADTTYPEGIADIAVICGGYDHIVNQEAGAIVGGGHNFVKYNSGGHSIIGGGSYNLISAGMSGIFSGQGNTITGAKTLSVVVGGFDNNIVASYAAIPGGRSNAVTGDYSFAFGRRAKATADGTVALSDSTDADYTNGTLNSFGGRYSGGQHWQYGTTGELAELAAEATVNITADATVAIAVNVPAGAKIIGCQLRVDTALTAGETWDAAYAGGATQAIASAQAVAKNTKVNKFFDANAATDITSDVTTIAITKHGGGAFTAAGTIRAIVYYKLFSAMVDAP